MSTYKHDRLGAGTLIKKTETGYINSHHPQQRESGQWSDGAKSDLVVTVLHDFSVPPVIICEQDGIKYLIDGVQRITTLAGYIHNLFPVAKKGTFHAVSYECMENGTLTNRTVDVSGMRYRDLPEELQDRFREYSLSVELYLDCTDEEVSYHIARYNQGRPMTAAQKAVTHMGLDCAQKVKEITAKNFFARFSDKERLNGTTVRIVTDAVMLAMHPDAWKKNANRQAESLADLATEKDFITVSDAFNALEEVANTYDVDRFLTAKDSFIWAAAYIHSNLAPEDFGRYMSTFDTTAFDTITGGTKDTRVVQEKLNLILAGIAPQE